MASTHFWKDKFRQRAKADLDPDNMQTYSQRWDMVNDHRPPYPDPETRFWEAWVPGNFVGARATAQEQITIGWVSRREAMLDGMDRVLALHAARRAKADRVEPPAIIAPFIDCCAFVGQRSSPGARVHP